MKLSYKYHTWDIPLWLLRLLKRRMRWVRAAGGIVTRDDGMMLLILRNGRWDLPKGKVEAGETLLQGALREVEEETGIHVDTIKVDKLISSSSLNSTYQPINLSTYQHVIKTYHIFNLYGGWHLKQTSWFPMHAVGNQDTKPQEEEGITGVEWVTPDVWHQRLEGSYGTLRTLSRAVRTLNTER